MLDMLKQTGRAEMVVGWYHSHPGFGCWLSGVDINTQQVTITITITITLSMSGIIGFMTVIINITMSTLLTSSL